MALLLLKLLLLLSLAGCSPPPENEAESLSLESLISEIIDRVSQDYVDETTQEKLVEGALNGLLTSLDPYSAYLNEADYKNLINRARGEFAGLGLEIVVLQNAIRVIAAIDDTPAHHAGIKGGDLITHINNQEIQKISPQEALNQLQGMPGTKVTLTLERKDAKPFNLTITRSVITINPVRFCLKSNIGIIRLSFFSGNAGSKLEQSLRELKKTLPKLQGIILDLRDNPGGMLEQAIEVASLFLDSKLIVEIKGRNSSYQQRLYSKGRDLIKNLPMIVLINGGTASAAEIVAGALKDHKRAILLGSRSFGKGSVQSLFNIPGHGGVRLTTARFYTPKGQSIHNHGIEPDIIVDVEEEIKKNQISNHPLRANNNIIDADLLIQRGIDLLRGVSLFKRY